MEVCNLELYAGPARILTGPAISCLQEQDQVTLTTATSIADPEDSIITTSDASGLATIVDQATGKWGIGYVPSTFEIMFIKDFETVTDTILAVRGVSYDLFQRNATQATFATTIAIGATIIVTGSWFPPLFNNPIYSPYWTSFETEGDVTVAENVDKFKTRTNQSGYIDTYALLPEVMVTAQFPRNVKPKLQNALLSSEYIVHDSNPVAGARHFARTIGRPSGEKLIPVGMVVFPEFAKGRSKSIQLGIGEAAVDVVDLSDAFIFYKAKPNLNKSYVFAEGDQTNLEIESDCCNDAVIQSIGTHGFLYGVI